MGKTHTKLRLSLVIPAYNEAGYLGACLDSIAAQTDMPDEVIVVDNNSSDETAEIARSYPFVTLIREKRQGLRFSRNTGLDADTRLQPKWVATARHAFERTGTQAMTGPCYYYDMPFQNFFFNMDKLCRAALYKENEPVLYGSNMVISRELWETIRNGICMDGEFFEDCDLTIHLQEHGFRVAYDKHLIVGVAARRLDDSPAVFFSNMRMFDETYARHGLIWSAAAGAKGIYYTSYLTGKPLRALYDAESGTMSLTRSSQIKAVKARPTSNT
jgi:glycosyltransferase involved in cell wall biosynthesis